MMKKAKRWISVSRLHRRYLNGSPKIIMAKLKSAKQIMPYAIQVIPCMQKQILCLDVAYVDEFCKVSGCKRKEKNIPLKTDNWKHASDLAGVFLFGSIDKISRLLKKHKSELPNIIQKRAIPGKQPALCLDVNHINEFCKVCGEKIKKSVTGQKTDDWLSAVDLAGNYLIGGRNKIQLWLNELQGAMPQAIQMKMSGNRHVLCLHKKCIDDFCAKSGYLRQEIISGMKTPEWKSVSDLMGHYVVGTRQSVQPWIYRLKNDMPYAIQFRRKSKTPSICLNVNYLDEFCKKSGLINKTLGAAKSNQR